MDYFNKAVAIYGNKISNSYYVRPIPDSLFDNFDFRNIGILYNPTFANIYTRDEPKKIYDENKNILEQNKDVQKEIENLFLSYNAKPAIFVGTSNEIIEEINDLLKEITGNNLPYNVKIEFCNIEKISSEYHKHTKQIWNSLIRGFCVHNHGFNNTKLIYVLHDSLLNMMLVLGHEIGHILTPPKKNQITEEAKAYSFEIVWLFKIKENNTLNLGNNIDLSKIGTPAANGIHDVAFRWVNSFMMDGKTSKEIYTDIINDELVILE